MYVFEQKKKTHQGQGDKNCRSGCNKCPGGPRGGLEGREGRCGHFKPFFLDRNTDADHLVLF
jgi:hypothetical protein